MPEYFLMNSYQISLSYCADLTFADYDKSPVCRDGFQFAKLKEYNRRKVSFKPFIRLAIKKRLCF